MERIKVIKKTFLGKVTSDKMDKTVTVEIETRKMHPLYKKFVRAHKTFKAHDAKNEASTGDLVKIRECRPVSKGKCWRLIEIVEKAQRG